MEEINLRELPEEIRKLEIKIAGYEQLEEGIQFQKDILKEEIMSGVYKDPELKNEIARKLEANKQMRESKELRGLNTKIEAGQNILSSSEIQLNYLKNVFKVELKIDTNTQRGLEGVTKKIKDLEMEETELTNKIEKITVTLGEKRGKIKDSIIIKGKTDEQVGEEYIKKLEADKEVTELIKQSNQTNKQLQVVRIQKEYLKRDLIIAGISRGIRL